MINIEGLDKVDVLIALYNNARVQGLGFLQAREGGLPKDLAKQLLEQSTYFDYLFGRVMKVDLSSDIEFDERLYDRDNGIGKAEAVINILR